MAFLPRLQAPLRWPTPLASIRHLPQCQGCRILPPDMSGPTTVPAQPVIPANKLRSLGFFLAGFYVVWTLWALLLVRYPGLNQWSVLRVVVRVAVWIVPTCLFVHQVEGPPVLGRLGLTGNWKKGLVCGFLGYLALGVLAAVQFHSRLGRFAVPVDPATWLSPIASAPIAEEVLFRGLVFRVLLERVTLWSALAVSALLFALIHLPYWWASGTVPPATLVLRLGSLFAYGLFFALLYRWSGSLYAPIIAHILNNFVTCSLGI
jgi:membrane protease YdiL (CAAX protease family)